MEDHMSHLAQAVKFSVEIQMLREELHDIPVKVREVEGELQGIQGEYEGKKSHWDQLEEEKKRLDLEILAEADRLKDKEERLNAIKTQKEYQAVVREISTSKTSNRERENKISKISEDLAGLKSDLAPLEEKVQGLQKQLDEEKQNIQGSLGGLDKKIKSLETALKDQLASLPDDIRSLYQRIQEKKQPPAALVLAGTCQECFMHLPPQLYIELQKQADVQSCPNCHRLLYLEIE